VQPADPTQPASKDGHPLTTRTTRIGSLSSSSATSPRTRSDQHSSKKASRCSSDSVLSTGCPARECMPG
jgi:hypothetical protein